MRLNRFRELARYGLAGVSTTAVNLGLYHLLLYFGLSYRPANLLAILASKLYAYAVNKRFVFRSSCASRRELLHELGRFALSRGFTGVVDYVGLIVCVSVLGWDQVLSKYILQAVIIALNYVLGKRFVFRSFTARRSDKKP